MSHATLGTQVSTMNLAEIPDLELPSKAPDGRLPTFNKMGFATEEIIGLTQDFVQFASTCKLPVLDGGAAYGAASIAALKQGATVIANEIDIRPLHVIAKNKTLTDEERSRLYIKEGFLPFGVDFPANSLGAIHISRVMHFFKPKDVTGFFERAREWLAPKGRIFILTMSPFHQCAPGFAKTYYERAAAGENFPGEITTYTQDMGKQHEGEAPHYLHAIDPVVLLRESSKFGFICKRIELFGGAEDMDYTCAILINNKE